MLVHGGWAGAWAWDRVVPELASRGVRSVAVDLPSVGEDASTLGDLYADADHVRGVIDEIGTPVVLCGHSYGGVVITDAAAGPHPLVRRLVYLAALMPDEAGTVMDPTGRARGTTMEEAAADITARDGMMAAVELRPDGTGVITEAGIPFLFGHDDAEARASFARFRPHNALAVVQPVRGVAWKQIPSTFVLCTGDETGIDQYRAFAKQATEVVELDAGHCPNFSHPAAVADILTAAARS